MESSEGTTAPHIQAEINEILDKGNRNLFADKKSVKKQIEKCISSFLTLFKSSVGTFEQRVKDLREVADGLERVHFGTTVGSLTGGVVSAVGGVSSLVALVLAPFTFGASVIIAGIGFGMAAAGGVTSGVSNITKMVNESMDRKNFEKLVKDYEDLMQPITECLRELSENIENLQKLKSIKKNPEGGSPQIVDNMVQVGYQLGRSLAASVPGAVRLVQIANLGKVAAQASRAVQVAGVFTGVFSGLFIALDVYFISNDANEIQNMRGTKTDLPKEKRSAAVEFIAVIRETARQLEDGLNELKEVNKMLNEGGAQRAQ